MHDFGDGEVQHGDTWITELELKTPRVRIPLVREDSSNYSDLAGYLGVIDDLNDRYVSVTWVVPKVVMCISWESTDPPGYISYSGYVLVALTDAKASVLQRVFGTRAAMSVAEEAYTRIVYESLGKDRLGHYRIRRTVTKGEDGIDSGGNHQWREGSEFKEASTIYTLKDGCLKERSHANRVYSKWDDKPTSLDDIIGIAWSELKSRKKRADEPQSDEEEEKLQLKKAVLKQNSEIKDENDCPLPLVIPSQKPIAIPLDPKDLGYPYNDVTQTGRLDAN